ncbi:RagB/SusD family nutrient uptake outer membrane protein [Halosquirtibacter xylanolyticus]|uniref:RagB/SusD family nutrient uptake outer membrane protein n=1 Tax=Halosquirtibacter xylanolyticus TaxID=3374599 RepID=UPI0037496D83|nr:RagB/SusD family nutrient uptake outer membrane protein [Prolixibacteraceae bacterium]
MKKIHILVGLIIATFLSSCSDFLDITPVGKVLPTTVEDYRALLTDSYNQNNNNLGLIDYRSDDYTFKGGDDNAMYIEHYFWNENNGDINTIIYTYKTQYEIIFGCNQVIAAQGKMTQGTEVDENQLVAEAYALRAMVYLDLVNVFADTYMASTASTTKSVPLVLKPEVDLNGQFNRENLSVIYSQINNDLIEAGKLMVVEQQKDKALSYRFSKVALHALKAKVGLLQGSWSNVISDANEALVLQSSLQNVNTEKDDFLTYKSVENILSIHKIYSFPSQRNLIIASTPLNEGMSEDGSMRKEAMLFDDGKTKVMSSNEFKTTFRVPEVMLMLAEASLRLDAPDASTAKTQLKKLIEARYTPAGAATLNAKIDAMDNAALLKEVLRQRRMELAFQGKRWVDLKRLGKPSITHEFKDDAGETRTETLLENDPRYVVKFPLEAIRLNPNLAQ